MKDYADDRLITGCIYCGAWAETRDHVPSRVLLDPPFPENLPVVGACENCNNGFSRDEEYFVCLIECALVGSTDPERIRRSCVAKILRRNPALKAQIEGAKSVDDERRIQFAPEFDRVQNVLLKLARGHAAFELSQPCRGDPSSFWFGVMPLMTEEQRSRFDEAHVTDLLGEVGSRASQRVMVMELVLAAPDGKVSKRPVFINDWVDVQDERYRYLATDDADGITIMIVISEYLACEVKWMR